jgi:hypothetical protein
VPLYRYIHHIDTTAIISTHLPLCRYICHYIDTSAIAIISIHLPLYRYICHYIDTTAIISTHLPLCRCICHYIDISAIISIYLPLAVTLRSVVMDPIEPQVSRTLNHCANQQTAKTCALLSTLNLCTPCTAIHSTYAVSISSHYRNSTIINTRAMSSCQCNERQHNSDSCTNTQFHIT